MIKKIKRMWADLKHLSQLESELKLMIGDIQEIQIKQGRKIMILTMRLPELEFVDKVERPKWLKAPYNTKTGLSPEEEANLSPESRKFLDGVMRNKDNLDL